MSVVGKLFGYGGTAAGAGAKKLAASQDDLLINAAKSAGSLKNAKKAVPLNLPKAQQARLDNYTKTVNQFSTKNSQDAFDQVLLNKMSVKQAKPAPKAVTPETPPVQPAKAVAPETPQASAVKAAEPEVPTAQAAQNAAPDAPPTQAAQEAAPATKSSEDLADELDSASQLGDDGASVASSSADKAGDAAPKGDLPAHKAVVQNKFTAAKNSQAKRLEDLINQKATASPERLKVIDQEIIEAQYGVKKLTEAENLIGRSFIQKHKLALGIGGTTAVAGGAGYYFGKQGSSASAPAGEPASGGAAPGGMGSPMSQYGM